MVYSEIKQNWLQHGQIFKTNYSHGSRASQERIVYVLEVNDNNIIVHDFNVDGLRHMKVSRLYNVTFLGEKDGVLVVDYTFLPSNITIDTLIEGYKNDTYLVYNDIDTNQLIAIPISITIQPKTPKTTEEKYDELMEACSQFIKDIGYNKWRNIVTAVTVELPHGSSSITGRHEDFHLGIMSFHNFVDKLQKLVCDD